MRTTLTLDDKLAERLAEIARETRKPFKEVVNEKLRLGLGEDAPVEAEFVVIAHEGQLLPGLDNRRFNELAWEPKEKLPRRNPPVWSA